MYWLFIIFVALLFVWIFWADAWLTKKKILARGGVRHVTWAQIKSDQVGLNRITTSRSYSLFGLKLKLRLHITKLNKNLVGPTLHYGNNTNLKMGSGWAALDWVGLVRAKPKFDSDFAGIHIGSDRGSQTR